MGTVVDFILEGSNRAFLASFIVMMVVLGLEVIMILVGISLSGLVDSSFDFDVNKPDINKPDISKPTGALSGFVGWVNQGQVPLLILFISFLGAFSAMGFVIQWIVHPYLPSLLPTLVAAPIALVASLPIVRAVSKFVGRLFPQDQTSAIGYDSLTGHYGSVVLGPATIERPGQAKVRDDFGTDHYVRIVPEGQGAIEQGANVVLLERLNSDTFLVREA